MIEFEGTKAVVMKRETRRKTKALPFVLSFCGMLLVVMLAVSSPASAGPAAMSAPQDGGDVLFQKRCGGCHSIDQDKEGPRLHHAYGSKAGSVASFKYSSALKASNVVWNDVTLDKWLTNTDSVVPDNDMDYRVSKPEERAAIIQYLKSIASK